MRIGTGGVPGGRSNAPTAPSRKTTTSQRTSTPVSLRTSLEAGVHNVESGSADGFRCDQQGNLWSSAADGVHCIDPSGRLLGKIKLPSTVSNITFGGRRRSRLFICASQALFAVYTNQRGAQRQ
jgi:sugar lactone lactonase YvrE